MSIGRSSLRCWIAAGAVVWGSQAAWGGNGEENAASQPPPAADGGKSSKVPADSRAPVVRKNGLMQLEEDLSRSLQIFKPKTSLESATVPQPRRVPPATANQNKRAKDQADRKKNWVFMNPDDLTAAPTIEELLNMPEFTAEGQEKKALSPMERFYQSLERRYATKGKLKPEAKEESSGPLLGGGAREGGGSSKEDNLPSEVRESEDNLRKRLQGDAPSAAFAPVRGTFSDIFGLGESRVTLEAERAHKAMMKDYEQWLAAPSGSPAIEPAKGFNAPNLPEPAHEMAGSQTRPTANGLGRSEGLAGRSAVPDPTRIVSTPPDSTSTALNQWNSLYTPPKPDPPKLTRPPPPSTTPPQRKFY